MNQNLSLKLTQYQVKNQTKIRTNQKVIRNDNNQLIVKKLS